MFWRSKKKIKFFGAFLEKVSEFRTQDIYVKELAKWKKREQVLKLFDQCKTHWGPVTHILEDFKLKDLQIETCYLKNTITPNLRINHRSDVDPVKNKYQMINVSAEQLIILVKSN